MGMVKVSDALHEQLRTASGAFRRSINLQAEHWMRLGMLAELYPQLSYAELMRYLLEAERMPGGLAALIAALDRQRVAHPACLPERS